jgi:hypothetical protein
MIPEVILDQIDAWHEEGHADRDILSQLLSQYPSLSAKQIEKLHLVLDLPYQPASATYPHDAMNQLLQLQKHRQQLLTSVEKRLSGDKVPVSLFNLYRGVLRDQEASLWKLIQLPTPEIKQSLPEPCPRPSQPVSINTPTEHSIQKKRSGSCSYSIPLLLALLTCLTACFSLALPAHSASESSTKLTPGKLTTLGIPCFGGYSGEPFVPCCSKHEEKHPLKWLQNISRRKQNHAVD